MVTIKKTGFFYFLSVFIFIQLSVSAQENLVNRTIKKVNPVVLKVTIHGKVTDVKTGEPLPGASIYFIEDKMGGYADAQGNYEFKNIPAGHHVVEVSHTGYGNYVEHLELNADTEKDFVLSQVIMENQGVIVTGVSGATSIRKTPVPVTSIRKSVLLQTPSANIIDALSHIPGVAQISTGPSISKPVIRGLGYNRVVTINDGVRQEGQQWGDEHGIEIDEMSVAKAEVLKGPASLMYGSDALAGVINFITNIPVAEGVLKGNILTNYQSNNGQFGINASLAGNKNGFNWNLYGTHKSAGNYQNKYDGKVLNSGFNEKNFGGYAGINKSWGYSHIIFSRYDQRLGLIEGERDFTTGHFLLYGGTPIERVATSQELDSRDLFVPQQRVQHNKIIADNNFAFKKNRLKVNLGYQNNIRQEFGNPEDPAEKSLFFDLKTLTYNVQFQLTKIKEWHTTFGVTGMSQANRNKGLEVLIPEYNSFDIGAFLYTQRFFKKATLSGGFRFDNRAVDSKGFIEGSEIKFTPFTRNFSNISGSVGVSLEPNDNVTIKANIARGFRAPTLAELASNGAHEGTNRYEYGDKDLKSETSFQLDGGIDLDYEHFSIGLAAFYNRMNDFIFYRKLESVSGGDSLVDNGGEFIPAFKFNQSNAMLAGLEISFDLHPHPLDWLHFENSFSFVRGKFDHTMDGNLAGSNNLPLIPAPIWNSELRADFKKAGKLFRNLYSKIEWNKTFKQNNFFSGYGTETATSGYALLNAGIGGDVVNKKKTIFSIYLGVSNLTDVAYQHHLSRLKYASENPVTGKTGVFNTGRNFSIKLNIPLEFTIK